MKYKIIRKDKKGVRDFEVGYASSRGEADGAVRHFNKNNKDSNYYYIKAATTQKDFGEKLYNDLEV